MKKIICILLVLLFLLPAFAEENPFAPYEIAVPQGAIMEANEGSHAIVLGKTRVVLMLIPRVPDDDPESALLRMVFQFDPDAVLEEDIPLIEGYVGVHALSEGKLGKEIDTLNAMILSENGDLLILSAYNLDGNEEQAQALLDAVLTQLTANNIPLVQAY